MIITIRYFYNPLFQQWKSYAAKKYKSAPPHATKQGRVTVPGKPSDELQPGTLKSILRQAGLKD